MVHWYAIRFVRCRPGFKSGRELEQKSTTQIDRFLTLRYCRNGCVGFKNDCGDHIADGHKRGVVRSVLLAWQSACRGTEVRRNLETML